MRTTAMRDRHGNTMVAAAATIVGVVLFLLPIYWMVVTSLKSSVQIFQYPPVWMPIPPQWSNYAEATRFIPFFNYIKNSAMYCALTILGALFSNSLVAYSFARLDWPFKKFGFLLTLSMMMIPFQVTMIPLFLMMHKLGWANTYLPLVVPHFFGNAFFIFLLRQFFMTIPEEYSSCARIDGAGELMIFAWIIIPQCKAALSVVALFQFIDAWRDFLGPLIYLNDESKFPISLGIQQFVVTYYKPEWGLLMAACVMTTVPIVVLFAFFQRYFVEGITITGLKG